MTCIHPKPRLRTHAYTHRRGGLGRVGGAHPLDGGPQDHRVRGQGRSGRRGRGRHGGGSLIEEKSRSLAFQPTSCRGRRGGGRGRRRSGRRGRRGRRRRCGPSDLAHVGEEDACPLRHCQRMDRCHVRGHGWVSVVHAVALPASAASAVRPSVLRVVIPRTHATPQPAHRCTWRAARPRPSACGPGR